MEKKVVARNGVTIYYYQHPNTHSVCISLYVKSGSLYENGKAGITHLLEHLHFRKLGGRSQKELYYELESIGANFGASTYKEFLQFYLTVSPKYFSGLVKIASDLLGKLEVNAKDFAAEKRVVLSEIREDDQKDDIEFVSNKYIWEGTNLQNSILGTIGSVNSLTLPMLQHEKEMSFTKENLFFYVTGSFTEEDIVKLADAVGQRDIKERPCTNNDNIAQVPTHFKNRNAFVKVFKRKFDMHEVKISFDVDFEKVSRRELHYLDSILSDGLCSLLRAELIEKKGLIYSFISTIEQYRNIGVYCFSYTVYKSKLNESVKSFINVINDVKKGISDLDMQATRVFKTDNQMQILNDPEALNWAFAYENHILDNCYSSVSELADVYRTITKEQLVRTANEIFTANNAMLVSMGNSKGVSIKQLNHALLQL